MRIDRLARAFARAALAAALCAGGAAVAQDSPNRPIRLVVPFPPGGASDILGRLVAERLGAAYGQSIVKAGKLTALGIATRKRSPLLPEVPAINGYEVALWNGILAPAESPADVVQRPNEAIVKVLNQPEVKGRLAGQGSEPVGNSPSEFRQIIEAETEKWKVRVKLSGARTE